MTGKAKEKLRLNYREAWFLNINEVTTEGDSEATFHLKQPQPALISLLASGYSPIYPCHVSAREMRSHPIGTGPVQIRRVQTQPVDQGGAEPGLLEARPALSRRHRIHDHPKPLDRDARLRRRQIRHDLPVRGIDPAGEGCAQPGAAGDLRSEADERRGQLCLSPTQPPFDNRVLRRAMAAELDRKSFIDILGEGQCDIGAAMLPPPEGIWGMPLEMLQQLTGYGPDVQKNREEARKIMRSLGYGPDNRLKVKISARNMPVTAIPRRS